MIKNELKPAGIYIGTKNKIPIILENYNVKSDANSLILGIPGEGRTFNLKLLSGRKNSICKTVVIDEEKEFKELLNDYTSNADNILKI